MLYSSRVTTRPRHTKRWTPAVLLLVSLAGGGLGASSQSSGGANFDMDRMMVIDPDMFLPFQVSDTLALREALEGGQIREDTLVLVMDHSAGRLALLTEQMAYHHIAQGEINGEPWMVTF